MEIFDCGRRLLEAPGEAWAISTLIMVMKSLPQMIWRKIRVFELFYVLLCLYSTEHSHLLSHVQPQFQITDIHRYAKKEIGEAIGRC